MGSQSAGPFIVIFVAKLLVAGLMRHILAWGHTSDPTISTVVLDLIVGFDVCVFLITP